MANCFNDTIFFDKEEAISYLKELLNSGDLEMNDLIRLELRGLTYIGNFSCQIEITVENPSSTKKKK